MLSDGLGRGSRSCCCFVSVATPQACVTCSADSLLRTLQNAHKHSMAGTRTLNSTAGLLFPYLLLQEGSTHDTPQRLCSCGPESLCVCLVAGQMSLDLFARPVFPQACLTLYPCAGVSGSAVRSTPSLACRLGGQVVVWYAKSWLVFPGEPHITCAKRKIALFAGPGRGCCRSLCTMGRVVWLIPRSFVYNGCFLHRRIGLRAVRAA